MAKKKAGDALGGMIHVKVTLYIIDSRSIPYQVTFIGGCHLPKRAVVEVGQQFNYPLLNNIGDTEWDKLVGIITDVPQSQRQGDGIAMVATIYSEIQKGALIATGKHQLAEAVTVSELMLDELLRRFLLGNPDFKEVERKLR